MSSPNRVLVVGPSYEAALGWANREGLANDQWAFVTEGRQLDRYHPRPGLRVVRIGTKRLPKSMYGALGRWRARQGEVEEV